MNSTENMECGTLSKENEQKKERNSYLERKKKNTPNNAYKCRLRRDFEGFLSLDIDSNKKIKESN